VLADLSSDEFVGALLPTMFSETTPAESVEEFGASMLAFHRAGFRAMARASAEDLHVAIPGSTLVVLPDTGHLCNIEAPEEFNRVVGNFLRDRRS
jgi:hypothetical protein